MNRLMTTIAVVMLTASIALLAQENFAGGEYRHQVEGPCLTDSERQEIWRQIEANELQLRKDGLLPAPGTMVARVGDFGWPIVAAPGFNAYGVHGISNFVDQNSSFPNQLEDYNCGDRTYDLSSGYNHQGIDFFTWPFGWYRMDNDQVQVVAVQGGTIVNKFDGNNDRSCGLNGGSWNAVYVRHDDNSIAWYGHLKKLSLTSLNIGQTINKGDYIGIVGSSGNSTGPHLHLEIYDGSNQLIEPYSGSCNVMNNESWWADQREYYDSGINQLLTHSAPPVWPACPNQEVLNIKNIFQPGELVYFVTFYRDQLSSQTSNYRIRQPDGTLFRNWQHNSDAAHYSASWWWWSYNLPGDAAGGIWTFEIDFEGQTYQHAFQVDNPNAVGDPSTMVPAAFRLEQNYPNPFNPTTTLTFAIPVAGEVSLRIFDVQGKEVATLIDGLRPAGQQSIDFDGGNLPSGQYMVRLYSGSQTAVRKMLLMK